MSIATALPLFPKFDISPESGTLGMHWKKHVTCFQNLLVALNITDKLRQKALLLHCAGKEVNNILEMLPDTDTREDECPLEKTIDAISAYFQPKQNIAYEEY